MRKVSQVIVKMKESLKQKGPEPRRDMIPIILQDVCLV